MDDQLEERVASLERAVTDGEGDAAALAEAAVTAERLEDLETAVDDLTDRVAELEAAAQALRGYVGNVRSVNRDVEERADLALARVEALTEQPTTDDGVPPQDGSSHGREQDRAGNPGHRGKQRTSSDRCDRCGRRKESGAGTEGSERRTPGSVGVRDGINSKQAGEQASGTVSAPDGGERWPSERDTPGEASWNESSASEPIGEGVRASDGSDTGGPIDRLRQLL